MTISKLGSKEFLSKKFSKEYKKSLFPLTCPYMPLQTYKKLIICPYTTYIYLQKFTYLALDQKSTKFL